jgi:SAM-dependent methyltransferase
MGLRLASTTSTSRTSGTSRRGWTDLPPALRKRDVSPNDVFIDLGCGKGRVLYQAARRYPLARVIGVEISARLAEVVRQNIDRNRHRFKCDDVQVVTSNAEDFEIPDDTTIVYLNFAFVGETLRTVIDNLLASIDRRPRELRLITRMVPPEWVEESGRFRLVRRIPLLYSSARGLSLSTYLATPSGRPR